MAAGLSVGMGGLAAGYAIGIVGDYVSHIETLCFYSNLTFLYINTSICTFIYIYIVCSRICQRKSFVRYYGFDLDFCRSSWPLWIDCRSYFERQGR